MTSQNAFSLNGQPDPKLIQTLIDTSNAGNPVAIISNHPAPQWFQSSFGGSRVKLLQNKGMQSGKVITRNALNLGRNFLDVLVLAFSAFVCRLK